jgi:biotin carboxyl carrier protein
VPAALTEGDRLLSPTVGTFVPATVEGGPLVPGALLGRLIRAGRPVDVTVPDGVSGVVVHLASGWLQYGDPIGLVGEASGAVAAPKRATSEELPAGVVAVRSETDGTVWLRPEPGKPAFAALGAQVAAGAVLALVEVMKTFTPVKSPIDGVVERVLVADGGSVQAGGGIVWVRGSTGG